MVFVKEDSVRNHGLKKELIFLFFPVAFMLILLVRKNDDGVRTSNFEGDRD